MSATTSFVGSSRDKQLPLHGIRSGNSFSRANSFRPVHHSIRQLYLWAIACFGSLGCIAILGSASYWDKHDSVVDAIGSLLLGVGSVSVASGYSILYICDCIRRRYVGLASRHELQRRLRLQPRAARLIASRVELRSMRVGGVFFGICAVISIVGQMCGLTE